MNVMSGDTTKKLLFVAVDATDFTTLETGLSSFTVYRTRDGGTPVAMTTPTVVELDSANMPGMYSLLLDEDMTITAGQDYEQLGYRITHAGMYPVTLTAILERPKITAGETLTVASGVGQASVQSIAANAINAASMYWSGFTPNTASFGA